MAELRLAMVGMGKAMSTYLSSLTSNSEYNDARAGLDRIRDALMDGASRDIESLMREWILLEDPTADAKSVRTGPAQTEGSGPPALPIVNDDQSTLKPASQAFQRPDHGPLTSLPRVPQTAPSRSNGSARPTSMSPAPSPIAPGRSDAKTTPDPLAGLGVTVQSPIRQGDRLKRSSPVGDPLGADL